MTMPRPHTFGATLIVMTWALMLGALGAERRAEAQNLFRAPLPAAPAVAPTERVQPGSPGESSQTPGSAATAQAVTPIPGQRAVGEHAEPLVLRPEGVPVQPMLAGPPALEAVSLLVVIPPRPHVHRKHDKVEIIVNESSLSRFDGKLDTKKQYNLAAELRQFPSLTALLAQLELRNGIGGTTPRVGIGSTGDFKSTGAYERQDRLNARLSALVIDVKPNGMLVLEARESIQSDNEIKTMVISGLCDPKDITRSNTVQSSQLANLVIRIRHEGQVNDATTKGVIPRVLEKIFAF
jgi:flagellar L-ring protein precursor FlgH